MHAARPDVSLAQISGDHSLQDDDVLRLIAGSLLRMLFAQHQDHSSVSPNPHLHQSLVRLYDISFVLEKEKSRTLSQRVPAHTLPRASSLHPPWPEHS